jgi:thiosulfate dehydrogenase
MKRFLWGFLLGLAAVPLAFFALAVLGRVPVAATSVPPALEAVLAHAALHRSVGHQSASLRNPLPATEANLLEGMKLYRNACDGCHGGADTRSDWGSKDFYPRVPQFGEAAPALSDSQVFWIVKYGIRYTGMAAASADMGDDDIWKIAIFLSRLNSLPQAVQAKWHEK